MTHRHDTKGRTFRVAVLPDVQNYVSYKNQSEAGFPFDARELLFDQMRYIARNAVGHGGNIAFAIGVGDSWEHPMSWDVDAEHAARGMSSVPNPVVQQFLPAAPREVIEIEVPTAAAAYQIISEALPFCVVPGNHDHDHMWNDSASPPEADAVIENGRGVGIGSFHCGSLDNWLANFGSGTDFFREKPWYVGNFREGANSAQLFEGGGYRFLHLGLEMSPRDDVLEWAAAMIALYPGLPTIVTIHEFLDEAGRRQPADVIDLTKVDPDRNAPQAVWDKFIARHDQILMVLNGHMHGSMNRTDRNAFGHDVHQMLADYQGRKRCMEMVAPDISIADGIGDGWLRLLEFDLQPSTAKIHVRTYSTYFKAFSSDIPDYARWYGYEQPHLAYDDFKTLDDFVLPLEDFHSRFAAARIMDAGFLMTREPGCHV